MAFGMFAFVSLGDEYFAYGAMAGLVSAVIAGVVCVAAWRPLHACLCAAHHHDVLPRPAALLAAASRPAGGGESGVSATLLVFFAIILLGGVFQALFGLLRLGSLIKFAPHPVMAGFQNMAAVLLFLVQLGNVLGFDHNFASPASSARSVKRGRSACWSPR